MNKLIRILTITALIGIILILLSLNYHLRDANKFLKSRIGDNQCFYEINIK